MRCRILPNFFFSLVGICLRPRTQAIGVVLERVCAVRRGVKTHDDCKLLLPLRRITISTLLPRWIDFFVFSISHTSVQAVSGKHGRLRVIVIRDGTPARVQSRLGNVRKPALDRLDATSKDKMSRCVTSGHPRFAGHAPDARAFDVITEHGQHHEQAQQQLSRDFQIQKVQMRI